MKNLCYNFERTFFKEIAFLIPNFRKEGICHGKML